MTIYSKNLSAEEIKELQANKKIGTEIGLKLYREILKLKELDDDDRSKIVEN